MPDGALLATAPRRLWEPAAAIGTGAFGAAVFAVSSVAASPSIALAALIGLVSGAAVVAFAPGVALTAMALVVPLERLGRFGDDLSLETFSLMRLVGLLALTAVLAHMVIRRQRPALSLPLILCAILQAQAFASVFYALDVESTEAHALTMLGAPLMLFAIAQGVRSWRLLEQMLLAWLTATIAICIYQVYDWHFGVVMSDIDVGSSSARFSATVNALSENNTLGASKRAMGTTSNPAVYGINLLLAMPFLFYRLKVSSDRVGSIFWILGIGLVLYNLLLTNTRAVLIFAVLVCLMISATSLYRLTLPRIALIAGGLLAMAPFLPQSVWDRILNLQAYELDKATNLTWRFHLWDAALRLGGDHWLTGIGVGNRTAIIHGLDPTQFDGDWIMAHNEFLQTFTQLGLPGLAVFVALLASIIWKTVILMRRCAGDPSLERQYWFAAAALCSLVIAPLFGLQVDVFHFPLKGWWLVAGLVLVVDRMTRQAQAYHNGGSAHAG